MLSQQHVRCRYTTYMRAFMFDYQLIYLSLYLPIHFLIPTSAQPRIQKLDHMLGLFCFLVLTVYMIFFRFFLYSGERRATRIEKLDHIIGFEESWDFFKKLNRDSLKGSVVTNTPPGTRCQRDQHTSCDERPTHITLHITVTNTITLYVEP